MLLDNSSEILHCSLGKCFDKTNFKDGAKNHIVNYRPISLLPKCSLLFETLVYRHIYSHVWMKIHPKQFGFQTRKNSVLQLLDYLEYAHKMKTLVTYTLYLDYEKAFDKAPHTILLSKLRKFGLDESFLELLSSYLKDRIQNVKIDSDVSDSVNIASGVPQRSVLCPLFFILFRNDLPSIFLDCIPLLFADDLKLLSNSLSFHKGLARISNWNVSNGMIANFSKIKFLPFAGKPAVLLNASELLENVKLHKDIGIFIASDLEWPSHVQVQLNKVRKAFFPLRYRILFKTPSKTKLNLYTSMVLSILWKYCLAS